jgi:hypothetical protein
VSVAITAGEARPVAVIGVTKFQNFFRAAAEVDVDRSDVRRYTDFINDKLYDLFLLAQTSAKANLRDVIAPYDLPITKGLQESIHQFQKMDADIDVEPILEQVAAWPQVDMDYDDETRNRIPLIAGGMSLAMARTFKIIDPELKTPGSEDWDRVFRVFNQLM